MGEPLQGSDRPEGLQPQATHSEREENKKPGEERH